LQTVRHLANRHPNPPIVLIDGTNRWTVNEPWWRNFQLDQELIDKVAKQRADEWEGMLTYVNCTDRCLMTTLREMLDDSTLQPDERCGQCINCLGHPIVPSSYDSRLAEEAVDYLKRNHRKFDCKTVAPKYFDFRNSGIRLQVVEKNGNEPAPLQIPRNRQAEQGLVLCNWMDAGWGMKVHDDKKNRHLSDELVVALADAIRRWQPWQPRKNWGWVTCVPSKTHSKLVPDFAYRLSLRLKLPFKRVVVHKEEDHEPQKSRRNNYHRCTNLDGTFKVKEHEKLLRGPVLLVDDIVRSTWTVTVIAALLRGAGSGEVFPVGLARIASED
jgi:ATP-dependent DNA helicase RecQ